MLKATQSTFVVGKMSRYLKRTDDVFVADIKSKLLKPMTSQLLERSQLLSRSISNSRIFSTYQTSQANDVLFLLDTDGRFNDFGHHMLQRSNVGCLMSYDLES